MRIFSTTIEGTGSFHPAFVRTADTSSKYPGKEYTMKTYVPALIAATLLIAGVAHVQGQTPAQAPAKAPAQAPVKTKAPTPAQTLAPVQTPSSVGVPAQSPAPAQTPGTPSVQMVQVGEFLVDPDTEGNSLNGGKGDRVHIQQVNFTKPFNTLPQVLTSLSGFDATGDEARTVRVHVSATRITKSGFALRTKTWGDGRVGAMWGNWIAIGTK
jgi:hypothetical protein